MTERTYYVPHFSITQLLPKKMVFDTAIIIIILTHYFIDIPFLVSRIQYNNTIHKQRLECVLENNKLVSFDVVNLFPSSFTFVLTDKLSAACDLTWGIGHLRAAVS